MFKFTNLAKIIQTATAKLNCYMNAQSSILGNRAIVIGGSITGLLTSRILTQYFKRVTIIERDRIEFIEQAY